jgi:hypothetical protein
MMDEIRFAKKESGRTAARSAAVCTALSLASLVTCVRKREECNACRRQDEASRTDGCPGNRRHRTIRAGLQIAAIELNGSALELLRAQRIAVSVHRRTHVLRRLRCIDRQHCHTTRAVAHAVGVHVKVASRCMAGVQNGPPHETPPQQGRPVVGARGEGVFFQQ